MIFKLCLIEKKKYFVKKGKFHVVGKNGKIEKSSEAHRGAVLVGRWSTDGSSLLTGKIFKLHSTWC